MSIREASSGGMNRYPLDPKNGQATAWLEIHLLPTIQEPYIILKFGQDPDNPTKSMTFGHKETNVLVNRLQNDEQIQSS